MLTQSSQSFIGSDDRSADALTRPDEYGLQPAPQLPSAVTAVFGSVKRAGRFSMPRQLHLKAAFAELKLDLRESLFPEREMLLVCESLCASVELLLPEGVTVVDHSTSLCSSYKVGGASEEHGPIIHLDGWSICSDVKLVSPRPLGEG